MKWMKTAEACRYCGGIARKVLYRAVHAGDLRVSRIGIGGRTMVFGSDWLDGWLAAQADRPAPPPRHRADHDHDVDQAVQR